jgi:hypothetical protein
MGFSLATDNDAPAAVLLQECKPRSPLCGVLAAQGLKASGLHSIPRLHNDLFNCAPGPMLAISCCYSFIRYFSIMIISYYSVQIFDLAEPK